MESNLKLLGSAHSCACKDDIWQMVQLLILQEGNSRRSKVRMIEEQINALIEENVTLKAEVTNLTSRVEILTSKTPAAHPQSTHARVSEKRTAEVLPLVDQTLEAKAPPYNAHKPSARDSAGRLQIRTKLLVDALVKPTPSDTQRKCETPTQLQVDALVRPSHGKTRSNSDPSEITKPKSPVQLQVSVLVKARSDNDVRHEKYPVVNFYGNAPPALTCGASTLTQCTSPSTPMLVGSPENIASRHLNGTHDNRYEDRNICTAQSSPLFPPAPGLDIEPNTPHKKKDWVPYISLADALTPPPLRGQQNAAKDYRQFNEFRSFSRSGNVLDSRDGNVPDCPRRDKQTPSRGSFQISPPSPETPPPETGPSFPPTLQTVFRVDILRTDDSTTLGTDVHSENGSLSVKMVYPGGLLYAYNQSAPRDKKVLRGDRIIEVNGIQHDTRTMLDVCRTARQLSLQIAPVQICHSTQRSSLTRPLSSTPAPIEHLGSAAETAPASRPTAILIFEDSSKVSAPASRWKQPLHAPMPLLTPLNTTWMESSDRSTMSRYNCLRAEAPTFVPNGEPDVSAGTPPPSPPSPPPHSPILHALPSNLRTVTPLVPTTLIQSREQPKEMRSSCCVSV
eukprot:GEMP01002723.1.p1 GENE.GEMP01002723.1~~GEMP01002723.1.p1  ORF type:complete len:620 (+),score=138.04 GEMP01002723.1:296-2155(+)